jgi:glycosyltransferase involved in cell wall biosynthesis
VDERPDISVVVPVYNEEANVEPLVEAVRGALDGRRWELVLVDDGSRDATAAIASVIARDDSRVRLIRLGRNYGQTTAMQAGFDAALADVVVSMDGDLQNDPDDIPLLVETLHQGYDLVAGYRLRRKDKLFTRKVPSWIANRLIRWVSGVPIRDNGCTLKAFRRSLLDRMFLYADMHRFIPAIAVGTTGARIAEVPVRHRPRRFGTSKYGLSRIVKVLGDLMAVKMIQSFRDRPLRMFGAAAAVSGTLSFLLAGLWLRYILVHEGAEVDALVFPAASLLLLSLACYLVMLGLIAEVALREARVEFGDVTPIVSEQIG